jgi:hypothetical protein
MSHREDKKPIPTDYNKLQQTTNYKCQGHCSCLGNPQGGSKINRSSFDQNMQQKWGTNKHK